MRFRRVTVLATGLVALALVITGCDSGETVTTTASPVPAAPSAPSASGAPSPSAASSASAAPSALPSSTVGPAEGVAAAWTQVGPDGVLLARAITGESECPEAMVDGASTTMQVRVGPVSNFPNTVCELTVDAAESLSVDDLDLPLLADDPQRVAVMGDSGCKVEEETIQDCSSPAAWPLETIATGIAGQEPDLIIHVGDIVYREAPCPEGDSRCAGSPVGSTWASNDADLFTPLGDNLRAAPWLFSRGNHESCGPPENGTAWFRYFDPHPYTEECIDYVPMYTVPVGEDRQIAVLDSSAPNTGEVDPAVVATYRPVFEDDLPEVAQDTTTWLLTHAAMWGFIVIDEGGSTQQVVDTVNLQEASGNQLPDNVEVVLSGGTHGAQALRFADGRPLQVVSGNGGDLLDPPLQEPLDGTEIAGTTIESGWSAAQFGYTLLEQGGDGWTITFLDVDGNELFSEPL